MNEKILIIDDEEDICLHVQRALKKSGITDSDFALSPNEALKKLNKETYDIILVDLKMPQMDGLEFFNTISQKKLIDNSHVILMTAHGDSKEGIDAINKGFFDYIIKPFNMENLIFRIKKAIEHLVLNEKIRILSEPASNKFYNIIGKSEAMKKIYKTVDKVADKDTTILLEGETGTGKEVFAMAIHKSSSSKGKVFIPVNCGTLTETLLESELFGYEKGAFTGAAAKKFGILETANNGTVFLDEINNASMNVQSNLLRFIETGEFIRVGGTRIIKCDTRIISASNKPIEKLVAENKFREDLFHRLNVVRITLPSLRNRKDDIPLLTDYFLDMFNKKFDKKVKVCKSVINYFIQYYWPGNVRQLKNVIQSMVLLNETNIINHEDLPAMIKKSGVLSDELQVFKKVKNKLIAEFETQYFDKLLKKSKGNVSGASKIANLNRKHLIEKLKHYKIDPAQYK